MVLPHMLTILNLNEKSTAVQNSNGLTTRRSWIFKTRKVSNGDTAIRNGRHECATKSILKTWPLSSDYKIQPAYPAYN